MAKHDYKSFILYSGDELGFILIYAREYIKKCNCNNKIKLFDLGVKLSSLSYYVNNLKSLQILLSFMALLFKAALI